MGKFTSLTPLPLQRSAEIAIDRPPGGRMLASSSHASGVAPPLDAAAADGAARSLRLGGVGAGPFLLCDWLFPCAKTGVETASASMAPAARTPRIISGPSFSSWSSLRTSKLTSKSMSTWTSCVPARSLAAWLCACVVADVASADGRSFLIARPRLIGPSLAVVVRAGRRRCRRSWSFRRSSCRPTSDS